MNNLYIYIAALLLICAAELSAQNLGTVVYSYDNQNRLTQVTQPNGTTIEYCYDNVGNMTCYEVDGATPLPDLAISAVELESTTLGVGSSFLVTALDTNYLSGSAAGHFVRFYLSDDDGFTEGIDEVLGTKFVTGLAGYGSDSIHQVLTIPELAAEGPQYLIVCTDANGNLVAEADEQNNCIAVPIQVNSCGTVSLTFDVTEESCLEENGAVSVNVAGGTGPFAYRWNTIPPATTASISDISAGTYTVTVTDGNNCETVSTVSVVNGEDNPSANFGFATNSLEVQFSNTSLDANSFAWDFGDGNASALSSPAHAFDFSGSYNVCLTISNACGADTTCRVVSVSQSVNTGGGSTPSTPAFTGAFNKVLSHYAFANSGNIKFVESTDDSYVGTTSGYYSPNGQHLPLFIKLDTLGEVINAFELLANDQASAELTSMEPADDGGFYARYRVYGTNGGADPIPNFASFIVHIDKDGQVLWQYRYYEGSNVFNIETMAGLAGDGLIAVGKNETQGKFTLLKLNGGGFREWSSRLTLSGSGFDVAKANATHVTKAPNGDYLIAFQLDQDVSWLHDFCLLRTDANGNTLWMKKFAAPEDEVVRGLEVFNGNVYLTGYSQSFNEGNNETEPFVIKMDSNGNVLWSKKYLDDRSGGASPRQLIDHNGQLNFFTNNAKMILDENGGVVNERGIDFYRGISPTADGGFVLSAAENNFRKVVKMKADGTAACEESAIAHTSADISFTLGSISHSSNGVLVSKQFVTVLNPVATTVLGTDECGGPAPVASQPFAKVLKEHTPDDVNQVTDCVQADDGSTYYLLWGENGQLSVQHYDTAGQVVFSKQLPGISISPKGLDVDENGNVVVFGHTEDFGSGGSDFFASLLDASGTTIWSKVFGGVEDDFLQDGTFDANGDVVLVGYSNYSSNWKSIVTKIDRQSGGVRWMKVFDDPNNPYDFIESIQRLRDDNFLMIGKFSSDATVIKMDADGQVIWANEFPENNTSFPPKYDPEFYDVFEAPSGELYLTGKHNVFQFDFKINITKLNANGGLIWSKDFDDNGDNCFAEQLGIIDDQLLATYQVEGSDGTKLGVASFDLNGNSTGANRHTAIANYELRAGDIKSNIILAGSIDYVSTRDAFIFVLGEDGSLPCEEQSTSLNGSVVDLVPGNTNITITNEPFGVTDLNLGAANKNYLVEDPCTPTCLLEVEATITHATCGESNAEIDLGITGNTGGVSFDWSNGNTGNDLTNVAAGEYAVTVTDAAGCEVVSSFIVQDDGELPTIAITPVVDCNEVSFNTVTTGATTYSWTFGDGNSATVESPVHHYLLEGTFEVCLTVANECGELTSCEFVTIDYNSGDCSTCTDGIQNGDETGIDCGGASCTPCPCTHPDYEGLMALYDNTNGDNWTYNGINADPGSTTAGWGRDCEPCGWYGVQCNGAGRVTCIDLDGNVNCGIDYAFGTGNNLSGPLPSQVGQLDSLEVLSLKWNALTGQIPVELYGLSELRIIDLYSNGLQGAISPLIGNLTNLEQLNYGFNALGGTIPGELFTCTQLKDLWLPVCQLTGPLPSGLENLTQLEDISIRDNTLSGGYPAQIWGLLNLKKIDIKGNGWTPWQLPAAVGNLTQLTRLDIQRTNAFGPLPAEVADLAGLIIFYADNNDFTGCFPSNFGGKCALNTWRFDNNLDLPYSGVFADWCNGGNVSLNAPCDDGNPTTSNDAIDVNCNCIGQEPSTCTDGIQNGDETSVDCGGPDCTPCLLSVIVLQDSVAEAGGNVSYEVVVAAGAEVELLIDNVSAGTFTANSGLLTLSKVLPGVHYLRLMESGQEIDRAVVRFESCRWSPYFTDGTGDVLLDRCIAIKHGVAYVPPLLYPANSTLTGRSGFVSVNDFKLSADSLEIAISAKDHAAEEPYGYEQQMTISLLGEKGFVSVRLHQGETENIEGFVDWPSGNTTTLGSVPLGLSTWNTIYVLVEEGELTVVMGSEFFNIVDVEGELGELLGMNISFSGSGSLDYVEIEKQLTGEKLRENFDVCDCELPGAINNPVITSIHERELRLALPTPLAPAFRAQNDLIVIGEFNGRYPGVVQREGQYLVFLSNTPFSAGEELNVTLAPGLLMANGTTTEKYTWKESVPARHVTEGKFFFAPLGVQVPSNALDNVYSFSCADFDGNGMMDLVFHYYTSYGAPSNQLIYLRDEDGSFQAPVAYTNSESHSSLQGTPDLNGDGYPDLLVRHNVPSSAMIRLNNGDGSFGAAQYYTVGNYASGFAYGDLDADGDLDIISGSGLNPVAGNTFTILTNDGTGHFTAASTTTGIFNASRHLADLDGDGDLDLVYTSSTSFGSASRFRIYENNGNGQLTQVVDQPNPGFQYIRQIVDLNGDDHLDLLLSTPSDVAVYGDGSLNYDYSAQDTLSSNRYVTTVVDVDADQDQDLLHTRRYDGTAWTGPVERRERLPDSTYNSWTGVDTLLREAIRSVDYDADGDIDHLALLQDRRIMLIENVDSAFYIDASLMLAGPFQPATNMMSDALRSAGYLPEVEPYGVDCQRVESDVLAVSGPTAIVDWIVVELRSDANHNVVLRSQTALLRRDGRVVDVDGESLVTFDLIPPAGYYISIRHRNHLGVMTELPNDIALRDTVVLDFTDATVTPTYGTEAQNEIAGKYVLRAGDANQDGIVRYSDLFVPPFTFIPSDALSVFTKLNGRDQITGYHAEDINMDGKVRYSDLFIPPFTIIPSDALRIFNALDGDPAGQEEERH